MTATETGSAVAIGREREGKPDGGSGALHRPALRMPEPWEFELLRLIAEQGAIPFDQLARFLSCEQAQATRVARHLFKSGFADFGRFLYDEPPWVWLSGRGARLSGTGFHYRRPKVGAMARMRAVNVVRLHIARRAPDARWICGRSVVREQGLKGYRPNAVVEIGRERHAIVVRLRVQAEEREREILETHMARHDAVVAFCAPAPRRQLERLQAEQHWPKLVVRNLPEPPPSPCL
jgi:MarR family